MDYLHKFMAQPLGFLQDYALPFIVTLGVVVFVHEWGHYIVARLCGVKVEKFSIGFLHEIFGWTDKQGTRWKVGWLPLGGYVQMFGDVDPASARHEETVKEGEKVRALTKDEEKVAFFKQSIGRRSLIVVAGPAINFLFAILVMSVMFSIEGQPYTPPVVGKVLVGSAAYKAVIKPDDRFIEINGREITKFEDLREIISINLGREMEVIVEHATAPGEWTGKPVTLHIAPKVIVETDRFGFKHQIGRIGVVSVEKGVEMRPHTIPSAILAAVGETWHITAGTLKALGQMIMGTRSSEELGGLLRIGAYAGQFAKEGLLSFVNFLAVLSVNLGLINLLPIPALDGGHLAFYAVEKLKGSPMNDKAQEFALRLGIAFLLGFMVFANWNDLVQFKVLEKILKLIS
jgi:regulator of sigma E protease